MMPPKRIKPKPKFIQIAAEGKHLYGLKDDGTVWERGGMGTFAESDWCLIKDTTDEESK